MSISRRNFLKFASATSLSFGAIPSLFADSKHIQRPHFASKAKRIIFLNMKGAPSHLDTFDFKPELIKANGKEGKYGRKLLANQWGFTQKGQSGLHISKLLPNIAAQSDELCLLRGMYTNQPNHPQAQTVMHTTTTQFVRPSLGSWVLYGLGTENQKLPGFVNLGPSDSDSNHYGSAFLPSKYQGTALGKFGRNTRTIAEVEVPNIENPRLSQKFQRQQLNFIQKLNAEKLKRDRYSAETKGVANSFELAYLMQDSIPEVLDISKESAKTKALYGLEDQATSSFAQKCLLARRFSEAGVRFVEISSTGWDHHFQLKSKLPESCKSIDKPIAGLIQDLKERGLLDETLIIWAGEFGRTPESANGDGRDHNPKGYTTWMAGGGVKGGFSYGSTDPLGYEAATGKMSVFDWHASILHAVGIDHQKLAYNYAGRDFRPTDVHGEVAKEIFS